MLGISKEKLMNFRKTALFLSLLLASLIAFTSCFGSDTTTGQGGTGGDGQHASPDTETPSNDSTPHAGVMKISTIIYSDASLDIFNIRTGIYDIIGIVPIGTDAEPARDGEAVFGNTNRAITDKARAELDKLIAASSEYDSGYIIYKEGNNIASYWTLDDMATLALSDFEKICIDEKKLVLDDGVIASGLYNKSEYEKEKYWINLSAVAPADVVASIKKLNNFFDSDAIVDFYANLYDPEVGGFYYAISARDTEGFLPDIETTDQVIQGLKTNGAYSDINAAYPTELKVKILEFAKSLQSPIDGYFYHPQWPQGKENLQPDRYGRDMSRATDVISYFRIDTDGDGVEDVQYPLYCAPNGVKCEIHDGTDEKCSFARSVAYYTSAFSTSASDTLVSTVSAAVAKVTTSTVKATASSQPDYTSAAAFSAWLEAYNYDIKENSGEAHKLSALREEITQHGYADIVLDHLDRIQAEVFEEQLAAGETPTGLWQRYVDYNAVWGFLKYSGWYNAGTTHGRAIDEKYIPYIIDTIIAVIASEPDGDYASNDLFNQWDSVDRLINNINKYHDAELIELVRDRLRENTAELVDISLEKIKPFKNENGSFALKSNGMSPSLMYGAPIALGIAEGNSNSTNIFCSMYNSILTSLGYPAVPLFNKEQGERFIATLMESEPIIKNEESTGVIDFEDGTFPTTISQTINNPSFIKEIVDDPEGERGSVLYVESPNGANGDTLHLKATGVGASCVVYETDIYVSSETETSKTSENIIQLRLGDKKNTITYLIVLKKNGNKIEINEETSTSSGSKTTRLATVGLDEWFTLRVEHYLCDSEENGLTAPATKIWINDELIMTSYNFYGSQNAGAVANTVHSYLNFYFLKSPDIKVYFDNWYLANESLIFEE